MLLFLCPPLDFEFQPPIREMSTRTEVHADARGNAMGTFLHRQLLYSPYKSGAVI